MSRWLALTVTLWVVGIATAEEAPTSPAPTLSVNVPSDVRSLLPTAEAIHVLVDDITGDGRLDLLFTSHSNNEIQIYQQTAPRHFEAREPQTVTGFHPNDTIVLPGTPKRYLINAEGENQLRVVKVQPDAHLEIVSERKQSAPRASTSFSWPGWDLSLAVVPFSGNTLTLLRDFKPETGEVKAAYSLTTGKEPKHVRLADLNGDGIDELVLASRLSNDIWVIDYPGPDKEPVPRRLWSFERGWPRHVLPFDIDRNGTIDLLVPMAVQQEIKVLLNDGKANFTEGKPIPYPGKTGIHILATGQDQDGTRYLLAGGMYALVLYQESKDAAGVFENIQLPLAKWPNWVELKDIDGDGWLDAVTANQGTEPPSIIYGPLWKSFTTLAANPKAG